MIRDAFWSIYYWFEHKFFPERAYKRLFGEENTKGDDGK